MQINLLSVGVRAAQTTVCCHVRTWADSRPYRVTRNDDTQRAFSCRANERERKTVCAKNLNDFVSCSWCTYGYDCFRVAHTNRIRIYAHTHTQPNVGRLSFSNCRCCCRGKRLRRPARTIRIPIMIIHNPFGRKNYTLNNKLFFFSLAQHTHCVCSMRFGYFSVPFLLLLLGEGECEGERNMSQTSAIYLLCSVFFYDIFKSRFNVVEMRYVHREDGLAYDTMS